MKKIIAVFLIVLIMISGLSFYTGAAEDSAATSSLLEGEEVFSITGSPIEPSFNYSSEQEMLSDMRLVSENSNYSLYFNTTNLAFGIVDKKSGQIHFSNPYNAQSDPYYTGAIAQRLDSQIVLNYVDPENVAQVIFSSTDSVALGQYSVSGFKNGVRVNFSIGEEIPQPLYPKIMSESYFKEVTGKLSESDAYVVESYYTRTDISEISDENRRKELTDMYPLLKSEVLYIVPSEMSQREQLKLTEIFEQVNYTNEQYNEDAEKYNFEKDINTHPNFKLSIEYVLTDEGLTVSIPYSSIEFDSSNFKLQSIEVLPYFVSDKPGNGTSYLFIPDGSGALIDINQTQENRTTVITGAVYGEDQSNVPEDHSSDTKQYYLPVFGAVKNNGTAIFSIIDNGAEISSITARLGAPNSLYYCAYNTFEYASNINIIKDTKQSSMHSARSVYLFDENSYNTDFEISYYFLSGGDASYTGMAKLYSSKLVESGVKEVENINQTKMVLNTIGTALYDKNFLGFEYKSQAEFTTYLQNFEMIDYFNENGVDDTVLLLSGWQKNGLDASLYSKIKTSSALGGKKDFKTLIEECEERSIPMYVEYNTVFAANDKLFDNFNKKRDTAKRLDTTYSGLPTLDFSTRVIDISDFTVSPVKYAKFVDGFFKSNKSYSLSGVDLAGFGTYLNSDFNTKKNQVNRVEAKNYVTDLLSKHSEDANLSVQGANAYVIPYVYQVRDITMENSSLIGETATVPFLQMVLSGKVFYSSEAINLSEEPMRQVLSCIESGTSPSFTLAYDNIELLKLTDFNYLYACGFENVRDRAIEYYTYIEEAMKSTDGSALIGHEILADNVSVSYFANGSAICVNKSNSDFAYNGSTVGALSYLVIK